ncbi:MAG: hypothetical protein KTR21_09330 [Rhodobacteraceae bacterium]|nr:hypothetical protein [Paracoccaceae bacterium]
MRWATFRLAILAAASALPAAAQSNACAALSERGAELLQPGCQDRVGENASDTAPQAKKPPIGNAAPASLAKPPFFQGAWRGAVSEPPESPADYEIVLQAFPSGAAVRYPQLSCGGVWTLLRHNEHEALFAEQIQRNPTRICVVKGYARLISIGPDQIKFEWDVSKSWRQPRAEAILWRQ